MISARMEREKEAENFSPILVRTLIAQPIPEGKERVL
jgi:hypothetical protein